jgi:hypothetical protein
MIYDIRPNLIIAGAQKSGTTTLATRLSAHPEIFLPPQKELNFFIKSNWYLDINSYLNKFSRGAQSKYRLDATPGYFWTEREDKRFVIPLQDYNPTIPESINSLCCPNTKIIIILRHPVFRAISAFFHQFRMGRISSNNRIRNLTNKFGLVDIGFYSDHIDNYLKVFPNDSIRIYFFEKYILDKVAIEVEIFEWLGLNSKIANASLKEENNVNFEIEFCEGVLRIKGGIKKIEKLKERDNRYKNMLEVLPPVVENEDMDFLNLIYSEELFKMRERFPDADKFWMKNPSLSDYV